MTALSMAIPLIVAFAAALAPQQPSRISRPTIQKLSAPLQLNAWDGPNCQGVLAWTTFTDSVFARNISNFQVCRSFRLNRTLRGQEQLDISVANDRSAWYPNKDQLSANSSSCTDFWQSYYATNGSTACHNTPPFTCHRLWNNPGLSHNEGHHGS
ncbi:hypothetical protein NUU61_001436 [Penicillium alfredii]|uniref:Uncharacterized protein n=1 Tax=Penicillium alfredii TaxID=1506179 RepID=A0A9W9G446_9EURO|nr:uncharacterized protein NUU61_001436 [Penicillium alfredii]KAJ5111806.1 hypothetical protein NUU61_001436 [Penicillium alfredii]